MSNSDPLPQVTVVPNPDLIKLFDGYRKAIGVHTDVQVAGMLTLAHVLNRAVLRMDELIESIDEVGVLVNTRG